MQEWCQTREWGTIRKFIDFTFVAWTQFAEMKSVPISMADGNQDRWVALRKCSQKVTLDED